MISTNAIINFRLAYLQAVALSWSDQKFKEKLLNPGENCDVFDLLKIYFDYHSPWPFLKFKLVQNNPDSTVRGLDPSERLTWTVDDFLGWTGPNSTIVINLPMPPPKENDFSEALSAYYQLFPTMFGPPSDPVPPIVVSYHDSDPTVTDLPLHLTSDLPVTDGSTLDSAFVNFGGITLRVISLGWNDPQFYERITNSSLKNADSILSEYFGFNNPWNFNIRFCLSPDFIWNPTAFTEKGEIHTVGYWKPIAKNEIILNLPVAPKPPEIRAIALTSYNNSGAAYPFSCL